MKYIIYFLIGLLIALGFSLLMAFPVMWLWNWLIPIIFPTGVIVHNITFMQAFGLSILIKLLHPNIKTETNNN